ncbi:MAG: enoyl-CoA hydratase/isomerase family protein [Actinomycetota bacterium]
MEHDAKGREQPLRLVVDAGIAWLTLERPRAMNAIDEPMLAELPRALDQIASDPAVKAAVVTGAGDAFCVGLDIGLLGRAFADHAYFRDVLERLKEILLTIEGLPVPVIAAVNGIARAGGFELLLACDLVLVAEEARLGDTHLAYGIVPGGGAAARAPRKLGPQRARELLLTGRWMSGIESVEAGLALRAVPRVRLDGEARALASSFVPLSRSALAHTKAAVLEGESLPLRPALDTETERFMRHLASPGSEEGYRAFVERREPRWP